MKRGFFNITSGVINQVLTIILGLIIPRMFILSFGSDINGLVSTINQVFAYFTLFEAGVLTVSLQSLYGPVANGNHQAINEIVSETHHYCKRIGLIYGIAMVIFALIFSVVISSPLPRYQVILLVLIQGTTGILNYFFMAKFKCLLSAEGKEYVSNNLLMLYNLGSNILRIVFLLMGCNVLVVQGSFAIVCLIEVIILSLYMKKKYHWLDYRLNITGNKLEQKNDALVHQISTLIFNNTDMIIISVFLGLGLASVYSVYNMIYVAIGTLLASVMSGVQYKLGQIFNTDPQKYAKISDYCETWYLAVVFILFTTTYVMTIPFMEIYTRNMTDMNYIDMALPMLFVLVHLLSEGRSLSGYTIIFAGHFKETKWRTITESVINIVVSLIAVHYLGIYGVLAGTIAALLYRTNDMIIYANKKILHKSSLKSYIRWICNILLFGAIALTARFIPIQIDNYFLFIIWGAIYLTVITLAFFLLTIIIDRDAFQFIKERYQPAVKTFLHK